MLKHKLEKYNKVELFPFAFQPVHSHQMSGRCDITIYHDLKTNGPLGKKKKEGCYHFKKINLTAVEIKMSPLQCIYITKHIRQYVRALFNTHQK